MTEQIHLERCPFCNSSARVAYVGSCRYAIECCNESLCGAQTGSEFEVEKAAALWNRRASDDVRVLAVQYIKAEDARSTAAMDIELRRRDLTAYATTLTKTRRMAEAAENALRNVLGLEMRWT